MPRTDQALDDAERAEIYDLQRTAWEMREYGKLSWQQIGDQLDEPAPVVRDWAQSYIARTDAARRATELPLF